MQSLLSVSRARESVVPAVETRVEAVRRWSRNSLATHRWISRPIDEWIACINYTRLRTCPTNRRPFVTRSMMRLTITRRWCNRLVWPASHVFPPRYLPARMHHHYHNAVDQSDSFSDARVLFRFPWNLSANSCAWTVRRDRYIKSLLLRSSTRMFIQLSFARLLYIKLYM